MYEWKGLKLEVDETDFRFGTLYEIEFESSDLEEAKKLIEEIGIFSGKLEKVREGKGNLRKYWGFHFNGILVILIIGKVRVYP